MDEKRQTFHALEDELQKAKMISDQMFKMHKERDLDFDWHKEKVDQLAERWQNVHSQIENRFVWLFIIIYSYFMLFCLFVFCFSFLRKTNQKWMFKEVWIVFWTVFGMGWDEDLCCAVDNTALLFHWECLWLLSSKRCTIYRNLLLTGTQWREIVFFH